MGLTEHNRSRLEQAIEEHGFAHAADYLRRTIKQTVVWTKTGPEPYAQTGGSRVGGEPDLPDSLAWPVDSDGLLMSFVLQLNLAELQDAETRLPADGMLFFFVGDYGLETEHRVLHAAAAEMGSAKRTAAPGKLSFEEDFGPYHPYLLKSGASLQLPSYSYVDEEAVEDDDHGWEEYEEISFSIRGDSKKEVVRMFGYAEGQHGDDEYLAALSLFGCEETYSPDEAIARLTLALGSEELARREVADIVMLAEIESDDDIGFMWGDAGVLHYFIRREDLLAGRFDRTYCAYYSS